MSSIHLLLRGDSTEIREMDGMNNTRSPKVCLELLDSLTRNWPNRDQVLCVKEPTHDG
jgi:hypothetical protein